MTFHLQLNGGMAVQPFGIPGERLLPFVIHDPAVVPDIEVARARVEHLPAGRRQLCSTWELPGTLRSGHLLRRRCRLIGTDDVIADHAAVQAPPLTNTKWISDRSLNVVFTDGEAVAARTIHKSSPILVHCKRLATRRRAEMVFLPAVRITRASY